ncbi:MAG: bifunctional [glutamate--ammonia ligase]-adenylyl-L-tyrosine phosphorylase/[glutamate--ammonia-ligase] adenylyltransferase [Gammaproteobacteria bacterium]|nr:bifunctional [glutamate--ammonia ligase]-adenylyl-L-tyrosine phosphorylase/[glutamate--ammonia-ligase] adenylyltransferase [Gammaproteobacteria bacterium]
MTDSILAALEKLPDAIGPDVERRLQRLREHDVMLDRITEADGFLRLLALSGFAVRVLTRQPQLLDARFVEGIGEPLDVDKLRRQLDTELAEVSDIASLQRSLRRHRQSGMLRIAWRDVAGLATLEQTLRDTSELADMLIDAALQWLHRDLKQNHGEARDAEGNALGLVVLGMGKLGGRELNFSSDIDLVFSFAAQGESDGERPLSNEQYFSRLGQRLIRVLDDMTADGFVYRVDMRLRPFGDGGPLVQSFDGMEAYYQQHGREWERYAFIKARPVAGDMAAGDELLDMLRPFVYRRYLDFSVFEALRDMKASINRDVQRRDRQHHVKLGPGGIREAEFIVQLFQLVRGGREPALRSREFLTALHAARDLDCLADRDTEQLEAAYRFLRLLENRLQMVDDQQTHDVPDDEESLFPIAWSMGFDSSSALVDHWHEHRNRVSRIFDQAFLGPAEKGASQHPLDPAWDDIDGAEELLLQAGFKDVPLLQREMKQLAARMEKQPPGAQGHRRVNALVPRLLAAAARQEDAPEEAAVRMLDLVDAVLGRTTYLALLAEHPEALSRLAQLFAASKHIAGLVTRHPILLDELLDPRLFEQQPDEQLLDEELEAALARTDEDDLEAVMDALREFQQVSQMRIAAADISGSLPLMRVSDLLTHLAERVIQSTLDLASAHLLQRHGRPMVEENGESREARFLVVAYGKLGGLELGYGSDLDLVFMHDSPSEGAVTDGDRSVENSVYFLRLTQRLIHLLSTPTTAGTLYEVDTRLRPSGKGGLLVTSLDAFAKYQREQAWTWEHQALLRARAVAGDQDLAEGFRDIRREVLTRDRDPVTLRSDVRDMRERMRREQEDREGEFHLKGGRGGITDIEFLTQYWVLREAPAIPQLLDVPDTIRFLERLAESGRLPKDRVATLIDAYRQLRGEVHACALQGRPAVISDDRLEATRFQVRSVWEMEFGKNDGQSDGQSGAWR